jgi:signal transduction histidine kinase
VRPLDGRNVESSVRQNGMREVLAGLREPVVVADPELRIRFLNPAAERALGVAGAAVEGEPLGRVLPGDPAAVPPILPAGWRVERTSDGWAVYGGTPAEAPGSETWLQQLVEAQQLAAVGQVAAGAAHEIGAPLTAISVAVEYLLKTEVARDSPIRKDLEMILAQTQRISRLARSLVDLARPGTPALVPTDLNAVVCEGYELVQRQLRRDDVEGVLELEPDLPPVPGDANQLQQVLINLLLNAQRAVQAPGSRGRRVVVRTRRAGDSCELLVSDPGPGIAEDDQPKVFLPFFSRAGGAGLGLSISRAIVHRHGGTLRLESRPGQGATFIVRLPHRGDGRAA